VNDIEKYFLEDELQEESDEETQQFEDQSKFKNNNSEINIISENKSPVTLAEKMHMPDIDIGYYNNTHTTQDVTTINFRNSTNQIYQPIHHRHFNNNYGK